MSQLGRIEVWVEAICEQLRDTFPTTIGLGLNNTEQMNMLSAPIRDALHVAKARGIVYDVSMGTNFLERSITITIVFNDKSTWKYIFEVDTICNAFDPNEAYERAMKILGPRR